MFEQMRDAMLVRLLVAAADAGPHAERRGFQMRHGVGDHRQPGWKLGDLDAHPMTPCLAARLTDLTNRSTSPWSFFMTFICSGLLISPSSQGGKFGRTPQ